MRSINSMRNAIIAVIMNIIIILIGFVSQKIFIEILGTEYLGINGLFTNLISMLGIVELGIGSAITYNLYKPIADKNIEKIKSLMQFYKISYRIISIIILIIGLFIVPFLNLIVGETTIKENIVYIYIMFLIDVIASYLLTYKRAILYADQKTYIVNIIHIIYLILLNAIQILILITTKNYILYLVVKIIFRILENIIITFISNRRYPYIKEKDAKKLEKDTVKDIYTKIKGLIYHKIGGFIVLGTDNIIISSFLGISEVGFYSNYNLIIQALNNLFSQVFSSITASVGNLLVENRKKQAYKIYRKMLFLNSWIFAFASAGIICIIEPFIKIWIGEEFILPFGVLIVLVINFYIQGMRKTSNTFKEAAGIFYEDRYVPIIESAINIVASVVLVKVMGLAGIFLGTIISTVVLFFYSYPKFVYKPLFNRNYIQYIKDYIPYTIVAITSVVITFIVTSTINTNNNIIHIIINTIIVIIIPNIIHIMIFYNSEEFQYYKMLLITNLLKNKKNRMAKLYKK